MLARRANAEAKVEYEKYLQLARDNDAHVVIEEAAQVSGFTRNSGPYAFAAIPARYAIERGDWSGAMKLQPITNDFHYTEALTRFARALGAARSGDTAAAETEVSHLARLRDALKAAKNEYWVTEVEISRLAASAWTALASGKKDEAVKLMRSAADMEDKNEKHIVTPGRIVPARELLGQMLLELKRPGEALKEFEASQIREPNRFHGFAGAAQAAAQIGKTIKVIADTSLLGRTEGDAPDVDCRVHFSKPVTAGSFVSCTVTGTQDYDLIATPV